MTKPKDPFDTFREAKRILNQSTCVTDDECEDVLQNVSCILGDYLNVEHNKWKMRKNVTKNVLFVLCVLSFWAGLLLFCFGLEAIFEGKPLQALFVFLVAAVDMIASAIFYGIRQSM